MKIGILAQYLETRPDITELIQRLALTSEVVVFRSGLEKTTLPLGDGIEIRTFQKKSNVLIKVWHILFKAFGRVPRSKHNYFITEDFKIQNSAYYGNNLKTWWNQFLLFLNYRLPGFVSYDTYISSIRESVEADLSGIDVFLCYTQIYDDGFLGKILEARKRIFVLVYSWDHPCKMKCFSLKDVHYLAWNQNIKNDLVELQGIAPERISVTGTSQFCYLNQFLRSPEPARQFSRPYLYFAFATGTRSLAVQEIAIIRRLSEILAREWPEASLMIRPYPFLKSKGFYDGLVQLGNVEFEPVSSSDESVQERMNHKYSWMNGSSGFFHFGTTLGVEAAFLRCPVFFLSLKEEVLDSGLYYFIHQFQNDAYLHKAGFRNTVESYKGLSEVIQAIASGSAGLKEYNEALVNDFSCESFESYSAKIESLLKA